MRDHRTRGVPHRWLLPPAPDDPQLAARWDALSFEGRRALARVGPADLGALPAADRALVTGLAGRRIATAWRLFGAALGLGWLVLMAVWGFGRSTFPENATSWLAMGLALGAAVSVVAMIAARRRLSRARAVADAGDP